MSVFLKVKQKSLAEEAKIIRLERRRAKARARWQKAHDKADAAQITYANIERLVHHERTIVTRENRATHLARNFLRGTPYLKVEGKCYSQPNWDKVASLISRYSGEDSRVVLQRFAEWKVSK